MIGTTLDISGNVMLEEYRLAFKVYTIYMDMRYMNK